MTAKEILAELNRLSLDERLEVLELLSRDIRSTLQAASVNSSSVEKVRGLLKTNNLALDDDELKRDYVDYLETKYS